MADAVKGLADSAVDGAVGEVFDEVTVISLTPHARDVNVPWRRPHSSTRFRRGSVRSVQRAPPGGAPSRAGVGSMDLMIWKEESSATRRVRDEKQ